MTAHRLSAVGSTGDLGRGQLAAQPVYRHTAYSTARKCINTELTDYSMHQYKGTVLAGGTAGEEWSIRSSSRHYSPAIVCLYF